MAHQIKIGTTTYSGSRKVLERHSLAALLGAVAAEWAELESRLMHLYAYLMGAYLPRINGYEAPIHPVALQVFDTLETTRLRLELLNKMGSWVLKNEALENELRETVVIAVQKAAKLRNTLVHAHWGVSPDYPDALIYIPIFGHQMAYQESDFHDAIDKIIEAYTQIGQFTVKARQHLDGKQT